MLYLQSVKSKHVWCVLPCFCGSIIFLNLVLTKSSKHDWLVFAIFMASVMTNTLFSLQIRLTLIPAASAIANHDVTIRRSDETRIDVIFSSSRPSFIAACGFVLGARVSLRSSSPVWVSEVSLARTRPLAASPLARAFSRDSLHSSK